MVYPASTTLLLAGLIALNGVAQERPSPQRVAAGEIIVKFRSESDVGGKVARAAVLGYAPTGDVAAYVTSIGRELGVPLDAKRLGSGGTVLVAIRTAELPETVARKVRSQDSVKSAQTVAAPSAADPASVRVEFVPGSSQASALARIGQRDRDQHAKISTLTSPLARASGVALSGRLDPSGQLLLTPDLNEITTQLAIRLGKRPDVEYAQPNYVVRPQSSIR